MKIENDKITVCDKCHQASCWQAIFFCSDNRNAGTIRLTKEQLRAINTGEHESYWITDAELALL